MTEQTTTSEKRKLTTVEQVVCAIPLVLVVVGGAIGGAAGGIAWALNQKIMQNVASPVLRYALIVVTFAGAIALYFVGLMVLAMLFPSLFAQP